MKTIAASTVLALAATSFGQTTATTESAPSGANIESTAAARRLRELGCDSGQGFLISRPLPALEFAEWYAGYLPFLHQ